MKDTNKSQEKSEVNIEQLEQGFNALSTNEVNQKQNNLDKDGEGEKFNNLSKDGQKDVPKKREPQENTADEKKDEASIVIKKEMVESEGKSSLEDGQRVNTQMDDIGDITKQMKELKVEREDKEGMLQSRGPSGGVGKHLMFSQAAYKSYNPDYHTGMGLPTTKQGGKRGVDNDFDDMFYKYNRPAEMVNYSVNYTGGVNHNLLEQNMVYKDNFCGGKMYMKQPFPDMSFGDVMGSNEASGDIVDDLLDQIGVGSEQNMMPHPQAPLPPYSVPNGFPPMDNGGGMSMASGGVMNDGAKGMPPEYMMPGMKQKEMNGCLPSEASYLQQKQDKGETSDYESPVCSPGSDISLNSPPPSNQSHDSGYGAPSPGSDMAKSPASRMSVSTYSSSPPRDGNQWGDVTSPMSVPPTSPPQTVPDAANASKYIDDNVELLHDVLNVIVNDIKQEDQIKKKSRQPCPQPHVPQQMVQPGQLTPQMGQPGQLPQQIAQPGQLPPQMGQPGQLPPQMLSQPSPPSYPQAAPPYPQQIQPNKTVQPQQSQVQQLNSQGFPAPAMANGQNGQVIIFPPASTAPVMNPGMAPKPIQPMGTQPMTTTTGSFVIVPGPPTTSVNSTPVPVAPVNTNGPCQIIIVTPQTSQPSQVKKKPLRPLKPKVPGQGDKNGQSGEKSPGVGGNKMMPVKNNANALQNARLQQQKAEMQKKQANLINVARRMVAEISREQLPFQDEEGDTYLHVAVCKTDPNMVKALLERLTRESMHHMIDLPNKHRQTPLYLAVAANQAQMVQMFVERNANPDSMAQVVAPDGQSMEVKAPIHVASSNGVEYLDTLRELLKSPDLNFNIVNSEGHTALHCAILNHGRPSNRGNNSKVDSLPIIEALIKAGVEPNSQDKKSGKTPLMYAIERKDANLVENMLRMFDPTKLRSIVKSQTFDGSSCLRIAEGLRGEFPQEEWTRLYNCLNCAQSGQVMNNMMYSRVY